jgi:hypothetical protein
MSSLTALDKIRIYDKRLFETDPRYICLPENAVFSYFDAGGVNSHRMGITGMLSFTPVENSIFPCGKFRAVCGMPVEGL